MIAACALAGWALLVGAGVYVARLVISTRARRDLTAEEVARIDGEIRELRDKARELERAIATKGRIRA